jgi:opacity protein-like surface antigen
MHDKVRFTAVLCAFMALLAVPVCADLSVFVATVGFDEDANLNRGQGIGLRWGKSGGLFGGETSVMVARPERELGEDKATTTALFYEGRLMVNLPLPGQVKPFAGVGFGAVTLTSSDIEVPDGGDEALNQALDTLSDLQTSQALSYGAGVKYGLAEKLDLRVDFRQYLVFSVKGLAQERLTQQLEDEIGMEIPDQLKPEDNTVQYNEFSIGVSIRF